MTLPEAPLDRSWLRFEQSTITGFGRPYVVDHLGRYRCDRCDKELPRKGRRCPS